MRLNKGQVSIEIIVLLGVLIIGAIIISILLIGSYEKNVAQADEVDSKITNIIDGFISDLNQVNGGGGGQGVVVPVSYSLTVTKNGNGKVESAPTGIDCGMTCSASYAETTSVTLTATPEAGNVFTEWVGEGCSGNSNCVVSMTQARNVTATFDTLNTFFGVISSPTTNNYQINQQIDFIAYFDNNSGPVTCSWEITGCATISKTDCSFSESFSSTGNCNVSLELTDEEGNTANDVVNFNLIDTPPLVFVANISSPEEGNSYVANNSILLSADFDNNSGPVNCSWEISRSGNPIASFNGCTDYYAPTVAGADYEVKLTASDGINTANDSVNFIVTSSDVPVPGPVITITFPYNDSEFSVGDTINFRSDLTEYSSQTAEHCRWSYFTDPSSPTQMGGTSVCYNPGGQSGKLEYVFQVAGLYYIVSWKRIDSTDYFSLPVTIKIVD